MVTLSFLVHVIDSTGSNWKYKLAGHNKELCSNNIRSVCSTLPDSVVRQPRMYANRDIWRTLARR